MPHGAAATRRVLHVAQPVEAGVAVVADQLVAHQVRAGYDVTLACPPSGSLPVWARASGATVCSWPAGRSPGPSTVRETRALAELVRRHRPDLVHLHSSKAGLAGRLALRGRLPTVFQPHAWSFLALEGPMRVASTVWERGAARWADVIACVSEDEQALGRGSGINGRWVVCPNGVDLERFAPVDEAGRRRARAELGLPDAPVVLCVGRLDRQKGQDLLVEAWRRMRAANDVGEATLVLVGEGEQQDQLAASAPADVVLAGKHDDVRPWYAAADVFVQPSRWEGASMSLREAMSCGLCVVATDVAGNRELPDLGDAVVPAGDVAALAAALADRLGDPGRRHREGQVARAVAERLFDLRKTVQRMDEIYADVVGRRA